MMKVSFDGSAITIDGRPFDLEGPILQCLVLHDRIIVVFRPDAYSPNDNRCEENVIAIESGGQCLWRIERSKVRIPSGTGQQLASPYTGVRLNDAGKVEVYEWSGYRHDLNIGTGQISNMVFVR